MTEQGDEGVGTELFKLEQELFKRWRDSLPEGLGGKFVTDGAVRADRYQKSAVKVLLLMKEVNDPKGGGWCLREFLQDVDRPQTWDTVARWVRAIRSRNGELTWDQLAIVTDEQRCQELQSIAAMNLKKIPGGHTTELGSWWQAVERDRNFINEQFKLYGADLVICCGSSVTNAFNAYIKPTTDCVDQWRSTSRGVEYLEYAKRKFVVAYSHPEARVATNLIHYGLVDAVREILSVKQD